MDFIVLSFKHVCSLVLNHPAYAVVGFVVGFVLLLHFYLRLTLGICHCTTDMTGKTVIVTGANSGIGKSTAQALAEKGAKVILACRNEEKALLVRDEIISSTKNQQVFFRPLDLASFASVRAFAKDILLTESRIDVLINNAGIITGSSEKTITDDGQDIIMQSNHLGHFLLTLLLLELLKKSSPCRIINVSSEAYHFGKINLKDLTFRKNEYWFYKYGCSKMANVLFTLALAKRLKGTGVTANVLHPGAVNTEIAKKTKAEFGTLMLRFIVFFFSKNVMEGAQTSIHLAIAPELETVTGKYFNNCKMQPLKGRWVLKEENAERLWTVSEKIVGLTS